MILNKEILFQNCEDLNVHYTNLIQSGGVFLGINMDDHKVIYASKNFSDIFNYEILYKDLNFLFSHDAILKLISYFKKNNYNGIKSRIFLSLEFKQKNDLVQIPCFLFFSNSTLCIEFQSRLDLNEDKFDEIAYQEMYQYISDFSGNLNELSNNLCKYISEVTGFERTYHCEFQQDEHGFIRANYTSNGLESLLHHHFPASDLPMQVRKIYIKNRFRFISNIDYIKVPIDGCKEKMDLTNSYFRDIGEHHLSYLKNMGLKSSASFSIVFDGRLQGILGCHSKHKKSPPMEIFPRIQILVDAFSKKLLFFKYKRIKTNQIDNNFKMIQFINYFEKAQCHFEKMPKESFELLKEIFNSHCLFYRIHNQFEKKLPVPIEFAEQVLEYLKNLIITKDLILIDKLVDINPLFEKWTKNVAAGMVVIKLSDDFSSFIVLLRPELLQTIKWSGNPNNYELQRDGVLNPRSSFATWYQEVHNKCRPWSTMDRDLILQLQMRLISIRSNYLTKSQLINEVLYRKILKKELLFSKVHQGIKNSFTIMDSIFEWKQKKYKQPDIYSYFIKEKEEFRVTAASNFNNNILDKRTLEQIKVKFYLDNLAKKIVTLIKENFYEDIKVNLDISENSTLKVIPFGGQCAMNLGVHKEGLSNGKEEIS